MTKRTSQRKKLLGLIIILLALPITIIAALTVQNLRQKAQMSREYPVIVIIHNSLADDQDRVEKWAKDAIENYFNQRLAEAGIFKRLKMKYMVKGYTGNVGCRLGSSDPGPAEICGDPTTDGIIRIWLYKKGGEPMEGRRDSGRAEVETAQVFVSIPSLPDFPEFPNLPIFQEAIGINLPLPSELTLEELDRRTLTHELGHIFDLPDYYRQTVLPSFNEVDQTIGIVPYVWDVMWLSPLFNHFSDVSKEYINRVASLPVKQPPDNIYYPPYIPDNIILSLRDKNDFPLSGALVDVFRQDTFGLKGVCGGRISKNVSLSGTTDNNGDFELKGYKSIFYRSFSALIRITYNNQVRYTAISNSYLNSLYFQGQQDKAIIQLPFDSLLKSQQDKLQIIKEPTVFFSFPNIYQAERQQLESYLCIPLQYEEPLGL